jgi:hypothetical protein
MRGSPGSPLEDPQPSVFAANDHRGGPDGEAECAGLSAPSQPTLWPSELTARRGLPTRQPRGDKGVILCQAAPARPANDRPADCLVPPHPDRIMFACNSLLSPLRLPVSNVVSFACCAAAVGTRTPRQRGLSVACVLGGRTGRRRGSSADDDSPGRSLPFVMAWMVATRFVRGRAAPRRGWAGRRRAGRRRGRAGRQRAARRRSRAGRRRAARRDSRARWRRGIAMMVREVGH